MGFVVDKVSEDSFYENLLLGISKVLEKSPCVSNLSLKRIAGIRQIEIRTWEHNNGVILPEDLRAFYSSSNGFSYTYDFSYDYNVTDESCKITRKGKIAVNSINDLIRIYGYETKNVSQIDHVGTKVKLNLSRDSKVFELYTVDEFAKVVLVYLNSYSIPTIWLYNTSMSFHYLADDFTSYFRMCIAHLGIPCWQYTFAKEGLPEWSREMFQLLAPGVLMDDKNLVEMPKMIFNDVNKIDPNIFITQPSTRPQSKDHGIVQTMQQNKSGKEKDKKNTKSASTSKKPIGKIMKKPVSGA